MITYDAPCDREEPGGNLVERRDLSGLWYIQRGISRVLSKTDGKEFSDYVQDIDLRDIVEVNLIMIASSLASLKSTNWDNKNQYQDIMSIKTDLIENYRDIDNQFIWEIITQTLPQLQQEVQSVFDEINI